MPLMRRSLARSLPLSARSPCFWTLLLTQQSLKLSRRTSIAELRAYLGVHSYKAVHMPDRGVRFSLRVQNFGPAPAIRLRCSWAIITGPPGAIVEEHFFDGPFGTVCSSVVSGFSPDPVQTLVEQGFGGAEGRLHEAKNPCGFRHRQARDQRFGLYA